ncbi:integrase [Ponticoccus alexandrii]|uniref:Phage integrase family protein n=1 Tax=Ponticoccus alexandrii TaxID=1943633 RepID=A0ABX7F7M8_9RHOB|nr:integrase [Ponticoccus alexandrii]QRF65851.1 hypothetical protein GQA70_05720 [Ponticoccus alexandrii]
MLLMALNTDMARQDLARLGRQHVKTGHIGYRWNKTAADMPILPELTEELRHFPADRVPFVPQDKSDTSYTVASLHNWFRGRFATAGVRGPHHSLRKAGARRRAHAGATEWEIVSSPAHSDTTQAAVDTKKAKGVRLVDSDLAKLNAGNLSNLSMMSREVV